MPCFPSPLSRTTWRNRGFTLVELMVVLLIAGLLCTLGWGGYRQHVLKAQRAQGRAALLQALLQEERHFSYHHTYAAFQSGPEQTEFRWHSGERPANSAYQIEARACTGDTIDQCVQVFATPGGEQVDTRYRDPQCGTLYADSRGRRSADGDQGCW